MYLKLWDKCEYCDTGQKIFTLANISKKVKGGGRGGKVKVELGNIIAWSMLHVTSKILGYLWSGEGKVKITIKSIFYFCFYLDANNVI